MNIDAPALPVPFRQPERRAGNAAWCLLTAGDEVSIAGSGSYQVIHLSGASAWIAGSADGSHQLVEAAELCLIRPCPSSARAC
jgi:hypothetical protein